jgi:hypothetical protein
VSQEGLPRGVWGIDEEGKWPGSEVPLYEANSVTICRAVDFEQVRDLTEIYNIDIEPILRQNVASNINWFIAKVQTPKGLMLGALVPFKILDTDEVIIKDVLFVSRYLGQPNEPGMPWRSEVQDQVRSALASFLFRWLGAGLWRGRSMYEVTYDTKLALQLPIRCESVDEEERRAQPSQRSMEVAVDQSIENNWGPYPRGGKETLHAVRRAAERLAKTSWIQIHGADTSARLRRGPLNIDACQQRYVDDDSFVVIQSTFCFGNTQVEWKAAFLKTYLDTTRAKQDDTFWDKIPGSTSMFQALVWCGYLISDQVMDDWTRGLPEGQPTADIEFFRIFNKPLPPLQPLNQFLPWAAKSDILPWSPLGS